MQFPESSSMKKFHSLLNPFYTALWYPFDHQITNQLIFIHVLGKGELCSSLLASWWVFSRHMSTPSKTWELPPLLTWRKAQAAEELIFLAAPVVLHLAYHRADPRRSSAVWNCPAVPARDRSPVVMEWYKIEFYTWLAMASIQHIIQVPQVLFKMLAILKLFLQISKCFKVNQVPFKDWLHLQFCTSYNKTVKLLYHLEKKTIIS